MGEELGLGKCDVCESEDAVGVAAAPGIPMSLGYGSDCINKGLHYPLWLLINNTAMIGGLVHAADWWKYEVTVHLRFFGVTCEDFEEQVNEVIEEWEQQA